MRLASFEIATPGGTARRVGALHDGRLVDLTAAYALSLAEQAPRRAAADAVADAVPTDMLALLDLDEAGLESARRGLAFAAGLGDAGPAALSPDGQRISYALADVRLLAPVPRPRTHYACNVFMDHLRDALKRIGMIDELPPIWHELPAYYKASTGDVIGPGAEIPYPRYTQQLDYELEWGCYIGRVGRNIPAAEAEQYIAGYTVFNDCSARDIQAREMQLGLGPTKGKDFCNVMGPWLVTPDELPDPYALHMTARVNGEQWSAASTGEMHWRFPELIEYLSRDQTLHPGDFISSGCVRGGSGLELGRTLRPGDVVELEVEGIGVLANPVGAQAAAG